jgi:hypothetical protein
MFLGLFQRMLSEEQQVYSPFEETPEIGWGIHRLLEPIEFSASSYIREKQTPSEAIHRSYGIVFG